VTDTTDKQTFCHS